MAQNLLIELERFLKSAKLSNYEIKAYITLIFSNNLTAREISKKSNIPSGRIYDVLDQLREKEIIEVQKSRPKIFRALPPNQVLNNLISHLNSEKQREITYLFNQAKVLESKIENSDLLVKQNTKIFWSTALGTPAVIDLYIKKFKEVQKELLMTGFLNENTLKVLSYAKNFYNGIFNAINRGVQVKYLWSFEFDERSPSNEDIHRTTILAKKLMKKFEKLFNTFPRISAFEMKFIHKRIPTYYDIFDKKRVLIKLQNPLYPSQIFVGMNVLDPDLANELRKKFLAMWVFEAFD
ncbi:MAG: TrmB family transcriptional regulator [Promethearchaeota archaeon]